MTRATLTAVLAALCALSLIACAGGAERRRAPQPAPGAPLNPALLDLPQGRWIRIHQQRPDDAVTFVRQKHGGSAFDSRRGRLVLFGSDTHATDDWTNGPLVFSLDRLEWRRLHPDDDPASYAVSAEGLPVAGPEGDHPWAMHTFGAVTYDPGADVLVVASYPRHMAPGRFTDALAPLWARVGRHPTWVLHLDSGRWEPLPGQAVHFFPYATAFDSHRGVVMGYRGDGVYELSLAGGRWRRVAEGGLSSWGNNLVYDSANRALVVFGGHGMGNDVVVYEPATGRHRVMPTPGLRPPGGRYVPLAYHPGLGRTVALIDRALEAGARGRAKMRAETWLYDLAGDAWTRVEGASLLFAVGMNYNLEYDPGHRLLLLVAQPPGALVTVWALRL